MKYPNTVPFSYFHCLYVSHTDKKHDQLFSAAARWCHSFFQCSNKLISRQQPLLSNSVPVAPQRPGQDQVNTPTCVYHNSRKASFCSEAPRKFQTGLPLKQRVQTCALTLYLTQPQAHFIQKCLPAGLSSAQSHLLQKDSSWCTKDESLVSKQFRDSSGTEVLLHGPQTALVCSSSVDSGVRVVCVALVFIMLSFSVPFLGSSLRLPLLPHNLCLRLTNKQIHKMHVRRACCLYEVSIKLVQQEMKNGSRVKQVACLCLKIS